jgi:anaerobic selenocysteine-containing dehydrogenase
VIDLLLKTGRHKLSLEQLAAYPHGKDLGPMTPARHERVQTDDRRAHLAPDVFIADLPRLLRWIDAPAAPIVLIGRRHMRSNNSWMHNLKPLVKGPSRAQLMMHPLDARARGIASRSRVRVRSRAGEIEVDVEVTDDVRPGVVSMPHGFGHDEGGLRLAGGLGPNVNAITDEQSVEPVLGNSILSGIPVDVDPIVPGAS